MPAPAAGRRTPRGTPRPIGSGHWSAWQATVPPRGVFLTPGSDMISMNGPWSAPSASSIELLQYHFLRSADVSQSLRLISLPDPPTPAASFPVVGRAIRHDVADVPATQIVPLAGRSSTTSASDAKPLEHLPRVLEQIAAAEPLRKVRDRSAEVRRQQLEQRLHRRREPADHRLRSRNSVATSVLLSRLFSSSVRSNSPPWPGSWLLTVFSSSLSDCSSSSRSPAPRSKPGLLVYGADFLIRGFQLFVAGLHLLDGDPKILTGGIELGLQLTFHRHLELGCCGCISRDFAPEKLTISLLEPSRAALSGVTTNRTGCSALSRRTRA